MLGYKVIVLIDTWWNVNPEKWTDVKLSSIVLIDTWWNVNCITAFGLKKSFGF